MQFIYSLFPFIKPLVPRKILNFYREFRKINWLIDHSEVVLYASSSFMPDYQPRKNPLGLESRLHQRVTLISTVLNEASNAYAWLNSLLEQSRLPDEVVITDGGSQDGTLSLLREIALTFPIPLRVIEAPGSNISQGRNQAIKAATHPLIACTDFGCQLAPEWLEKLVLPFEDDEQIQLSAGFYQVHEESRLARIASQLFLPGNEKIVLGKSWHLSRVVNRCWGRYIIRLPDQIPIFALGICTSSHCLLAPAVYLLEIIEDHLSIFPR
jgi:glycosyltransferase involved in cell wall biosynthesis